MANQTELINKKGIYGIYPQRESDTCVEMFGLMS